MYMKISMGVTLGTKFVIQEFNK